MGRMIFDLTDDDRAFLEGIRRHRGLRSQAETLRELIREASVADISSAHLARIASEAIRLRDETVADQRTPELVRVVKPPKRKPLVSRLKGEWKAP